MNYIIGIDQGATKTAAVVADQAGNILGTGYKDGSCYNNTGIDHAMSMIKEAYMQALNNAGIRLEDVTMLISGMTGADWPYEYQLLENALRETSGIENVTIYNDCIIALRSGTDKPYAAVICAGSGLNVASKSPEGDLHIYGYYIDDNDQGGDALGKRAIRAVFASSAGVIPPTMLIEAALDFYDVKSVDNLLHNYINKKISAKQIRDFTPALFKVALDGDVVALDIIKQFGISISQYVIADLKRFNMLQTETEIILSGSIFKDNNPILCDSVTLAIHSAAPKAVIKNALYEPVVGAVLFALDQIYDGIISNDAKINIRRSCKSLGLIRHE
jgi:N-acetylglucosamine kinase-like BadF-type ATPase